MWVQSLVEVLLAQSRVAPSGVALSAPGSEEVHLAMAPRSRAQEELMVSSIQYYQPKWELVTQWELQSLLPRLVRMRNQSQLPPTRASTSTESQPTNASFLTFLPSISSDLGIPWCILLRRYRSIASLGIRVLRAVAPCINHLYCSCKKSKMSKKAHGTFLDHKIYSFFNSI